MRSQNRYKQLIERVFFDNYSPGDVEVEFKRTDLEAVAQQLGIVLPKNLGDVIYSFRYRIDLPDSVIDEAPLGRKWQISPNGRGRYRFKAVVEQDLTPQSMLTQTKIPDSTPGIVAKYSLNDEQALLAKVRYNRLVDIFTGVTCYSLQNHLRTYVSPLGQVETDEIYVGVDQRGAQYIFPVQAKGGKDKLNIVQIEQDFAVCETKFPDLICHAIAAQFMNDDVIAMFSFEMSDQGVSITREKHYRLVPPDQITPDELRNYRQNPID